MSDDLLSLGYTLDSATGIWCRTYTDHRKPSDYRRYTPHKTCRKLTDDQTAELVRLRRDCNTPLRRLAEQFGITEPTVKVYLRRAEEQNK